MEHMIGAMRVDVVNRNERLDLSARWMAQILDEEGFDAAAGLALAGLDPKLLGLPVGSITAQQELIVQRYFASTTAHRRDLWLELGRRHRLPAFGPAGLAVLTAPTLRDLVRFLSRERATYHSMIRFHPVVHDHARDGIEFSLADCPEDLRPFTLFHQIGACMTMFASVWLGEVGFTTVELAAEPLPDPTIWQRMAIAPLFGARTTRIMWDTAFSRQRLRGADDQLHAHYAALSTATECDQPRRGFVQRAQEQLSGTEPARNLGELADRLALSRRSLQRRLASHGLNFRDLRDHVRIRRAAELLREGVSPIGDIAHYVGFDSRGGFDNAFQRVFGLTAGHYRRRYLVHDQVDPKS
jgi:AraC-like DNA-binding protein